MSNQDITVPIGRKFSEVFAFHEAGHALVAYHFGQKITEINLTTLTPATTHTTIGSLADEVAVMALGGVGAQVIREWPAVSAVWKESREKLARKRLDANTYDLRLYRRIASPDNPETFEPHVLKAFGILEANWAKVQILAAHLQTAGKVTSHAEFLTVLGES